MVKKFLTQFDCIERNSNIFSEVGSRLRYGYKYFTDEKGSRSLVIDKDDVTDVYEIIQACADDVDIVKMYQRYLDGDISALDKNQGWYADITEMPKNMAELVNMFDEQERTFNGLPTKFKQRFNNDYKQYAMAISKGTIKQEVEEFYNDYYNEYKYTRHLMNIQQQEKENQQVQQQQQNEFKSEVKENEKS